MMPWKYKRLSLLFLGCGALCTSACHSPLRLPVTGTLAGQHVATTVDTALAQDYLAQHLPGLRTTSEDDTAMNHHLNAGPVEPSDREALRQLAQRSSTDFAALHFVARLYDTLANRRAQDTFQAFLHSRTTAAVTQAIPFSDAALSSLVAFVPGYAYKKDQTTGADFARQRRVMSQEGFRTVLIETDELGSVEANATVVAEALVRLGAQYDKIILVSTSKGGAEVALALGEHLPASALRPVQAWISIGGLLQGSPYADYWLAWPQCWLAHLVFTFQGLRPQVIHNLSTPVRRAAFARLRIPAHILTVQYVGVPLSGHIDTSTRGRYRTLQPFGPNDGLTLLADELLPGSLVVTDIGLDHYYRHPQIDLKTLALAYVVFEELQRREQNLE